MLIKLIRVHDEVVSRVVEADSTACRSQPLGTAHSQVERLFALSVGWPGEDPHAKREVFGSPAGRLGLNRAPRS